MPPRTNYVIKLFPVIEFQVNAHYSTTALSLYEIIIIMIHDYYTVDIVAYANLNELMDPQHSEMRDEVAIAMLKWLTCMVLPSDWLTKYIVELLILKRIVNRNYTI